LPLPVWPYAKSVQLTPSRAPVTKLRATLSKTRCCEESGPNTSAKGYEKLSTDSEPRATSTSSDLPPGGSLTLAEG